MPKLLLNGRLTHFDVEPDMPLLWVLREVANLTATKYGCDNGACGACTVHVDGKATRSCQIAIGPLENSVVITLEGLAESPEALDPLQRAWIELQATDCGFCQPGMIMAAAAMLRDIANPTDADIDSTLTNLCRCGSYPRIRAAIKRAAEIRRTALPLAATETIAPLVPSEAPLPAKP